MMVLPLAYKIRLTLFIKSKKLQAANDQGSPAAEGKTIMNLPCLTRALCQFLLKHS
jgi:hypothetical protein